MLYMVIVAGAVVRMTGSGMGCPDWPRCFGCWVPPTDVSQLPANYQEIYSHRGYADTTFNVFHTWTEYINRLIGALTGFALIILLVYALKFWRIDRKLVWYCLAVLIAIGFQGWLGKVVVDSVLAPVKITIHMLMALMLAAMLIYIIAYVQGKSTVHGLQSTVPSGFKVLLSVAILFTLIQVAMGTQVRQQIDEIAKQLQFQQRDIWISRLTSIFKVHRTFSLIVLGLNSYLFYQLWKTGQRQAQMTWIMILLFVEIVTGVTMNYAGIPYFIQPIHLVIATVIFGLQFYLLVGYSKLRAT